ncbi:MAG: hypothetical protein LBQ02_00565 [Candidatus Nomurabacteria bacterium]|nr:hypothetical protein [Candidatus Nomurabacteria bacterium]
MKLKKLVVIVFAVLLLCEVIMGGRHGMQKNNTPNGFNHFTGLQVVYSENNSASRILTITLPGVQNSGRYLFDPHIVSMRQRGGEQLANIVMLDYRKDWFDMSIIVYELVERIESGMFDQYDVVYLDGVSCGAKVFAHLIIGLHEHERQDILDKIVFHSINGVISPKDIKTNQFNLAKWLPYIATPIITPILKSAHQSGWQKEADYYGMLEDVSIAKLNQDANDRISWLLLKDQVKAMNTKLPELVEPIRIQRCVGVFSENDTQIDNESNLDSLEYLFGDVDCVSLPTGHSTLAYQPDAWRRFYVQN